MGPPLAFRLGSDASAVLVRHAIVSGAWASGFEVVREDGMVIQARSSRGRTTVEITISYDQSTYSIEYARSEGLGAVVEADGEVSIHRRYHGIVDRLAAAIARELSAIPGAVAPTRVDAPARSHSLSGGSARSIGPSTAGVSPSDSAWWTGRGLPSPRREGPETQEPVLPLVVIGGVVLGGTWVANLVLTLATGTDGALSFVPLAGPFAQLSQLRWDRHERWTGVWYPIAGVLEVAGLAALVIGQLVQMPVGRSSTGRGRLAGDLWLAPGLVGQEGVGVLAAGRF